MHIAGTRFRMVITDKVKKTIFNKHRFIDLLDLSKQGLSWIYNLDGWGLYTWVHHTGITLLHFYFILLHICCQSNVQWCTSVEEWSSSSCIADLTQSQVLVDCSDVSQQRPSGLRQLLRRQTLHTWLGSEQNLIRDGFYQVYWQYIRLMCAWWHTWHALEGRLSRANPTSSPHQLHYDPSCVLIILHLSCRLCNMM